MSEEGIIVDDDDAGLLGGAAMVAPDDLYVGSGLGLVMELLGTLVTPVSFASFFFSLFSCLTSFSYLSSVENTSSPLDSTGLLITAGDEYSF